MAEKKNFIFKYVIDSRLLERTTKLSFELGEGSITP
jgi:F0F1-type ATP synthase alpha subunit